MNVLIPKNTTTISLSDTCSHVAVAVPKSTRPSVNVAKSIMSSVKRLFCGMGVNPTMYELDQDPRGKEIKRTLVKLVGINSSGGVAVPVVFVGGKLVRAMGRVMAAYINGTLVPLLKKVGALWL